MPANPHDRKNPNTPYAQQNTEALKRIEDAIDEHTYPGVFFTVYNLTINHLTTQPEDITDPQWVAILSLHERLERLILQSNDDLQPFTLFRYLIHLNFNHPLIYKGITDFIQKAVEREVEVIGKLHLLYKFRTEIKQQQQSLEGAFFPDLEGLYSGILRFIKAETMFIDDTLTLIDDDFKGIDFGAFKTALTVQQLSMLAKLLVDVGLIIPEQPKLLRLFIIKNFRTHEGKLISEKSVYNHFYDDSDKAREQLLIWVKRLGDYLDHLLK